MRGEWFASKDELRGFVEDVMRGMLREEAERLRGAMRSGMRDARARPKRVREEMMDDEEPENPEDFAG